MRLEFPKDRIVGRLDWIGAWEAGGGGPVLAVGGIKAPDDIDISLEVVALRDRERSSGGGWQLLHDDTHPQVDLEFLRELPSAAISRLSLRRVASETFAAVRHLQPGLVALYLVLSDLGDEVLPHVAALSNLNYLQTFGNHFTDAGVQQLVALQKLKDLYLEEETLTHSAFAFTSELPRLERLGLQDVPLTDDELRDLRLRLPHVRVG